MLKLDAELNDIYTSTVKFSDYVKKIKKLLDIIEKET